MVKPYLSLSVCSCLSLQSPIYMKLCVTQCLSVISLCVSKKQIAAWGGWGCAISLRSSPPPRRHPRRRCIAPLPLASTHDTALFVL